MKNSKYLLWGLLFFFILGFSPLNGVHAQENAASQDNAAPANQAKKAPPDEARLAQLLAPIALYPDQVLMQMLVASTYPLEIVEAARFVKEHPELKDEALDKALEKERWDVSVKSLCHFPTVLESMDKNLEATKELGEIFLENQKAVMDMIQTLRAKAKEHGNLKSTEEQKVVEKEQTIIIEPAQPDVVYVPTYSCSYVYGPWWYPSYPPYVWYPPPPSFRFVAGVVVGAALSHGWYHANWARGRVDVNVNRNVNVNVNRARAQRQAWRFNPEHRKGVAYNRRDLRQRYGQVDRAAVKKNLQSRGYQPRMNQQTRQAVKKEMANRRPAGQRGGGTYNAPQRQQRAQQIKQKAQQRPNVTRPSTNQQRAPRTTTPRSNSFNVSGSRSQAYRSSARGRTSRNYSRSRSYSRPRSGGARRGGGGRRR
jgi:hypothetical protein